MTRETERVIRELQKFMENNTFENDEDAEQAFMQYINRPDADRFKAEPDAYDYLEKAQTAASPASAVKFAKKALELDPTLIEAELLIAIHQAKDSAQMQSALEGLLKKEEARLAKENITEEQCAGEYYLIFETRPYLRLYQMYIETLITQGKIRKAVEACSKVLMLNDNDNLGVRYTLMAVYAMLEERTLAEALYQKYPEEGSSMLLPMLALYYKLDDTEAATDCLKRLCANNKSVKQAVKILRKGDEVQMMEILGSPYYSPFSKEELVIAYCDNILLYMPIGDDFLKWVETHIPTKSTSGKKQSTKSKKKA